jgi:hypothetical protein
VSYRESPSEGKVNLRRRVRWMAMFEGVASAQATVACLHVACIARATCDSSHTFALSLMARTERDIKIITRH